MGAFDGESYSNTSFLADQGWRGVYVEPIPRYFWRMKLRHAFNNVKGENVGIGDASGNSEIKVMGPLSTMNKATAEYYEELSWAKPLARNARTVTIRTEPLEVVLARNDVPHNFNLMVVDVEGGEEMIIRSLLASAWRPRVLIIELCDVHPDFASNAQLVDFTLEFGLTYSRGATGNTLCIPSTRSLRYEFESKLEQCCVAAEAADLRSPSGSAVDRPQQLHCRVGPPIESVGDAAHTRCRWGGIALQSSISRRDANLASVSGDHLTSVFVDADPESGNPFSGQANRVRIFRAIIETISPAAIIETGTYRTTTEFMASIHVSTRSRSAPVIMALPLPVYSGNKM